MRTEEFAAQEPEAKFVDSLLGGAGGAGGGMSFIQSGDATQGGNVSGGVAPPTFAGIDLSFLNRNSGPGLPWWGWLFLFGGGIVVAIKVFK